MKEGFASNCMIRGGDAELKHTNLEHFAARDDGSNFEKMATRLSRLWSRSKHVRIASSIG
jgi:hypothetical protein